MPDMLRRFDAPEVLTLQVLVLRAKRSENNLSVMKAGAVFRDGFLRIGGELPIIQLSVSALLPSKVYRPVDKVFHKFGVLRGSHFIKQSLEL